MSRLLFITTAALVATAAPAVTLTGKNIAVDWKISLDPTVITAAKGDVITFTWEGNNHNVYQVADASKITGLCDFTTAGFINRGAVSPVTFTMGDEVVYFGCEKPGHCAAGQHLKVIPNIAVDWKIRLDSNVITAAEGAVIIFTWEGLLPHNVYQVDAAKIKSTGQFQCDFTTDGFLGDVSPITVIMGNKPLYFGCSKLGGGHCMSGQYLTVIPKAAPGAAPVARAVAIASPDPPYLLAGVAVGSLLLALGGLAFCLKTRG